MQLLVEAILLFAAGFGTICLLLATIHDMKRVHTDAALRGGVRKLTKSRQPHVTFIVFRSSSLEQLQLCLRHIQKSRYKRYDVVVADRALTAQKRQLLIDKARIKTLHIYSPQRKTSDQIIIANAYRRSQRGEFVIVLSAGDVIEPFAAKESVVLLQKDGSLSGVRLYGQVYEPISLVQLFRAFSELGKKVVTKAYVVLGGRMQQNSVRPAIYRHDSFIRVFTNNNASAKMAYRYGLSSDSEHSSAQVLPWYGWIFRLLFIVSVGYFLLSAAVLQSVWPLMMAWVITCLWLVAAVWSDETMQAKRKAVLSVSIPIGMFVILASYVVSGLAAILRQKTF